MLDVRLQTAFLQVGGSADVIDHVSCEKNPSHFLNFTLPYELLWQRTSA